MNDDFVGRREADHLLEAAMASQEAAREFDAREAARREASDVERWEEHRRAHALEERAVNLALKNEAEREDEHRASHVAEHAAHAEKHDGEGKAITTALDSVNRERSIHADAHAREHEGHQREHASGQLAIDKAEGANDKRFASVNGTREQLNDMIRSLATKESVDALVTDKTRRWEELRKELDRRFEEQRVAITNIEKGDVKQEGKGLGQTAVVAIIVTAIGLMGSIISAIIIVANFLS